jgi:serine/threonine-protein kinase
MELVEGQTLAQRLLNGPVSVDESLAIARQIAEALEEAHEKGIVHRDLKPANINVMVDGKVKVLDFGLAKALDPVGLSGAPSSVSELAKSPTITHAATQMGMILGTAAYMAPEQAKGQAVDKRADIWPFGVVLYEMLTGAKLFAGDTLTETLAGVLKTEIEFSRLPPTTPQAVRRLLRRCLERNPKNRLRDIGDLRLLLDDVRDVPGAVEPERRATRSRQAVPWAIALVAVAAAGWALWSRGDVDAVPRVVTNLELGYPQDVEQVSGLGGGFAITPDGRTVAIIGVRGGVRKLARRLPPTQRADLHGRGREQANRRAAGRPDQRLSVGARSRSGLNPRRAYPVRDGGRYLSDVGSWGVPPEAARRDAGLRGRSAAVA